MRKVKVNQILTSWRSWKSKAIDICMHKSMSLVFGEWVEDILYSFACVNEVQKVVREKMVAAMQDITDGELFL